MTTPRKTKFHTVQLTGPAKAALKARQAEESARAGRHVTLSEIVLRMTGELPGDNPRA